MSLVDDGIVYQNPEKKSDGYTVVEGVSEKDLVIPYVDLRGRKKKNTTDLNHSTVSEGWCDGGFFTADVLFNFNIAYRSPALFGNHYSSYQLFLYQTISEHREKGLTFDAIAEWLNKEGYPTLRGKRFKGAHVHSILRKRLAKEELLKREYPAIWSDFSLEVVDKTILMSDFEFSK